MDERKPRDGRVIEELGWYDPEAEEDKKTNLNRERIEHWLKQGAVPTETVHDLLKKQGKIEEATREYGAAQKIVRSSIQPSWDQGPVFPGRAE